MSQSFVEAPKFKLAFFHPKFWLTWLGILILYAISWLPYRLQTYIGKGLGKLLKLFAKKRVLIAKRNLALCFPDYTPAARQKILDANLDNAGMAILEASMGWWWPTWRIEKMSEFEGYELSWPRAKVCWLMLSII